MAGTPMSAMQIISLLSHTSDADNHLALCETSENCRSYAYPAELRNQIYDEIFADSSIGINNPVIRYPATPAVDMLQGYNHDGSGLRYDGFTEITSIVRACKQTHIETRVLPLSKLLFCLSPRFAPKWDYLFAKLTDTQRHAITSIALTAFCACEIEIDYEAIRQKQPLGPQQDIATPMSDEDEALLLTPYGLRQFTGLQRVEVYIWPGLDSGMAPQDWARAGICFCAGNQDLEVVLKLGSMYSYHIGAGMRM
jgi:hypothetical protein